MFRERHGIETIPKWWRRQDICNWIVISTCCGHSLHWKIDFESLDGFKLTERGWFKS